MKGINKKKKKRGKISAGRKKNASPASKKKKQLPTITREASTPPSCIKKSRADLKRRGERSDGQEKKVPALLRIGRKKVR